jgi:superfamily II helicase
MRPICKCGLRPKAINYQKNNKVYYRSLCEICMAGDLYKGIPRWVRAGYKMKSICEKCGFKSPHSEVFRVFHVDGDLNNCKHTNLKTVCCNCTQVLSKEGITWRQGDLIADY